MFNPDHDGIIVIGKRKKGKTTLKRQLLAHQRRVILYDAKGAVALQQPVHVEVGQVPYCVSGPNNDICRVSVQRRNNPFTEVEWSAYLAIMAGRCIWACDELADALEGKDPGESVAWVVRMGRERDVRFICTFQRPAEVPKMVTANASDWYIFQTNEPNDLKYIADNTGSKESATLVRGLKLGQALHVKDGVPVGIMEAETGEWLAPK